MVDVSSHERKNWEEDPAAISAASLDTLYIEVNVSCTTSGKSTKEYTIDSVPAQCSMSD